MTQKLNIVLAQLNLTVGAINHNLEKHLAAAVRARDELSADLIIFPELSITGYPPEDLLLRKAFIHQSTEAVEYFIKEMRGIYCLIGHPLVGQKGLLNACSLIYNGQVVGQYAKQNLPNYGVFDERRYFEPGYENCVVPIHGIPTGLIICEDLWAIKPYQQAAELGAQLILSPNASPFEANKHEQRISVFSKRIKKNPIPLVYVNCVGGQDELLFDGGSMILDSNAELSQFAGFFNETLLPVTLNFNETITVPASTIPEIAREEKIYQALVLSLRDYINKNNLPGVVLGLSGGIDSALTLTIAVDALGAERVKAILMPSRYTSDMSNEDAMQLAMALNVQTTTIPIQSVFQEFQDLLAPAFINTQPNVTEENIQARARAIILMAWSNKFGDLVLTTGNRSELAVGYCTLYGDMAGGFNVIKDIYKTEVYVLANYRNSISNIIPQRIIQRAPSAELAPDQKDEDSLPPYSILDEVLKCYLDEGQSVDEIIAQGFDNEMVIKVVKLIRINEYKRKQAALGTHIHHKSFVKDWRYPVTNRFKG